MQKYRNLPGEYGWFFSSSDHILSAPVAGISEVKLGDIYLHWVHTLQKCQMWAWSVDGERLYWSPAFEGQHIKTASGGTRILVVTDSHSPSLVLAAENLGEDLQASLSSHNMTAIWGCGYTVNFQTHKPRSVHYCNSYHCSHQKRFRDIFHLIPFRQILYSSHDYYIHSSRVVRHSVRQFHN